MLRKTKIVCTIGPASNNEAMIEKLFKAGMNVARHNFSHGTHESHKANIDMVKRIAERNGFNYAIILDTKGPEIRTKDFAVNPTLLTEGSEVTVIAGGDILGNEKEFAVTYESLAEDVKPGNHILIDDGLVDLEVISVEGKRVKTRVMNSGEVSNHKGVNLPGVRTNLPALTEKDIEDLKFGIENDIDIVAASFIRKAEDVLAIRKVLQENGGSNIHIYSKIENQEGVDNVEEIIKYSDGIMVARGDLGVEIPIEKVPMVQKNIIRLCNIAGKPVITATQMLDSMMRNPRPTRAEVSDVANAIMDGSDSVMLSGETASGKYPEEAVIKMAQIAIETEKRINYEQLMTERMRYYKNTVQDAIASAACTTSSHLEAKAIITATQSGSTARSIAKFRPKSMILATTPNRKVARKLSLNWGVFPVITKEFESTDEMFKSATEAAKEMGFVENGDLVVISAGVPINYMGSTNMIKVELIGDVLVKGKTLEQTNDLVSGKTVFARDVVTADENLNEGDILIVKQLTPEFYEVAKRAKGIIVETDVVDSNIQVDALKRNAPIVYCACDIFRAVDPGDVVTIDGIRSLILKGGDHKIENLQNVNKKE